MLKIESNLNLIEKPKSEDLRRSRTALFFVFVAEKKWVEQTTNFFT